MSFKIKQTIPTIMAATTNKKIANFICISLLALMFFEIFNGIFCHFINNNIHHLTIHNQIYPLKPAYLIPFAQNIFLLYYRTLRSTTKTIIA